MARAVILALDAHEQTLFQKILRSQSLGKNLQTRAQIVVAAAEGLNNTQIAEKYGIEVHRVGTWRNRFHESHEHWKTLDAEHRPKMRIKLLTQWLSDKKGRGKKATITPEQKELIRSVACEKPSQSGYPHTQWSNRLLAKEVIKRGIVNYIAFQTVWSFLKSSRLEASQEQILVKRQD